MDFLQVYFRKLKTALRLARRAFGPYKGQILLLAGLGFLSGLLEGVGINALIPLLALIVEGSNLGTDFISETIRALFLFLQIDFSLKYILVFIVILFILKSLVLLIFNYIKVTITAGYEKAMRARLFKATLRSSWSYSMHQKLGRLETAIVTNVSSSADMLEHLSHAVVTLATLTVYALIAFNISSRITLIILAFGLLLFLTLKPVMDLMRMTSKAMLNLRTTVAHYIGQHIVGMKSVKALHVESPIAQKGNELFEQFRRLRIRQYMLRQINGSLLQPISIIFVSVVFAFSYKTTEFEFAALVAVLYLTQRMFSYMQQLLENIQRIIESAPYVQSTLEYETAALNHIEQIPAAEGMSDTLSFNHTLRFREVSFGYEKTEVPVLTGLSFSIPKGATVGLIGASGSGKTTVVDLLLRLLKPTDGSIMLDDVPVEEISLSVWRNRVGYVSQDIFLLNDTIRNNIAFYDSTLSEDDIIEAAKMANIYDAIMEKSEGLDTVVGERGIFLSAGQRQRIAIARVLARKPEILILDEATSALDNESESQIQRVIEDLRGKVTVLIVAHRLSTVLRVDNLIVLAEGRLLEQGAPQTLLADPASYFHRMFKVHGQDNGAQMMQGD